MKNIIITGASTGIGEACAIAAAEKGYKVYAGYRKEEDGQRLSSLSEKIIPVKIDFSNTENINSLYKMVEESDGALTCLFITVG